MPRQRSLQIQGEFITLGQLLKVLDVVGSGAEVKQLLEEMEIRVNGEPENRRGRKLRAGDVVVLPEMFSVKITA
jgi:ribosome-associated protein